MIAQEAPTVYTPRVTVIHRAAAVALLCCALRPAAAQETPFYRHEQMTDVRHAVAPSGVGPALVMNPRPVTPVVFSDSGPGGEPGFWGWTDFHVLYPIDGETLMRSLTDLDGQASFCPHVSYSEGVLAAEGEPRFQRHLQELTFDYVIYRRVMRHELDNYIGALEDGRTLYLDFRLTRTLDGGLTYCAGSWYLRPMTVDGKQYTYARFYMLNCVQGLPGIVKLAMRTFPGIETPATMNAFYGHAVALRDDAAKNAAGR